MNALLKRAGELKQALTEFVLEAEGDIAVALETYTAEHLSQGSYDIKQRNMLVDTFLCEGKVGNKTPLELFLEEQPDLKESQRDLISNWHRSFIGLFEIIQILPECFIVMNWLTAKQYQVVANNPTASEETTRLQTGDILLTRIAPVNSDYWMFFGSYLAKGKLGKPKLAVAIGEFKQNYKSYLYSDAPDLLEQSWESVALYHQEFVEFLGSNQVTLSGNKLNQKISEIYQSLTKKSLDKAGIDDSKSLLEIAKESGTDEAELSAVAQEAGVNPQAVAQAFNNQKLSSMVTSKVELPEEIRKAEEVTAFSHPRWGQMFIPTYSQFKALLEAQDWQKEPNAEALVRKYLEDPQINFFIWQQLGEQYPTQLEKILQTFLERPNLSLESDLKEILQKFNKPSEPELPETASVPQHLHELFESAVAEVNKSKSKRKVKKKAKKGFQ
ncbi:MAG: hypothetical protein WA919_26160 [Coleofasciculaceae cyanobacterium]